MTRENIRNSAVLCNAGLKPTSESGFTRKLRAEIKDRQAWTNQSLESLSKAIDAELVRRESAPEARTPAPQTPPPPARPARKAFAPKNANRPEPRHEPRHEPRERKEKAAANDHLSFEEALRREVADFQEHYRAGVMRGR